MSTICRRLLLLCALTYAAFAQTGKIDPSLNGASGEVPVVILLSNQPQADVAQRTFASFLPQLQLILQSLQNLPGNSALRDGLLDQLERLVARIRATLKTEIDLRITPLQSSAQARWGLLGGNKFRKFRLANAISLRIPASALASLQNDFDVAYVFRDQQIPMSLNVSVPAFGSSSFWNAPLNIIGTGIKVGVIDTGVAASHPALAGAVTDQNVFHNAALAAPPAESLYGDDGTVNDNQGHGSHVAGIIASRGTTAFPTNFGVAKGASIVNLKAGYRTTTGSGSMYFSDFFEAIEWGYFTANVSIFNYSFGGAAGVDDPIENQVLDDVIKTYGIFLAVAAGNSGRVNIPGYAYNTTQVGAMDDKNTVSTGDDTIAPFSSVGPSPGGRFKPDIVAPGVNIVSLDTTNGFVSKSGTSMATPHVAGAAALLRQAGVTNPLAIKAALIHSAPTTGWTTTRGWGYSNLTTAASQFPLVSVQSIAPGTVRLYKMTHTTGTFKSTMVWDRYFTGDFGNRVPNFNDLAYQMYNRTANTLVGVAPAAGNNVDQIATATAGNYVVRLSAPPTFGGGLALQEYALITTPTTAVLTPANGPSVSINCIPPSGARMNVPMTVSCTATNSGDLEAYSVVASTVLPTGWGSIANLSFGTLLPGASNTLAWTITPKTFGASITLPVSLTSTAFGLSFPASTNVVFPVLPPLYNITGRVTLNTTTGVGVAGVTVTLSGAAAGTTTTDSNGNYSFLALASAASYTITPTKAGTKFAPLTYTVAALNANTAVNFTATATITISGRITDPATGLGVANVTVRTLGTLALTTTTNTTGNYTLLNVNQGGSYSLIPTPLANTKLNFGKRVYLGAATMADITNADFTLSSTTVLTNNESTAPVPIPVLPAYIVQATAAGTVNTADPIPSCAFERGNDSVWYQYVATFTGPLEISTFGSTYDTLVAVYSGTAAPATGTEVGCSDDFAGSLSSRAVIPVVSGQTYRILISGANASTAGATLVLTVNQAN
jgi:serine protease AprX